MESPEEKEEEVKNQLLVSTSSYHHLFFYKWTSPIELWITQLKFMELTLCTIFFKHYPPASCQTHILYHLRIHCHDSLSNVAAVGV